MKCYHWGMRHDSNGFAIKGRVYCKEEPLYTCLKNKKRVCFFHFQVAHYNCAVEDKREIMISDR